MDRNITHYTPIPYAIIPPDDHTVLESAFSPPPAYSLSKKERDRCEVAVEGGHEKEAFVTRRAARRSKMEL